MKDCRRTLLDEFVKLSKDWDNNNMLYNSLMFSKLYPGDVENSVADASLMPKQSDEKMRNDIMTSWWTPTKIFLLGNKKELMQNQGKNWRKSYWNGFLWGRMKSNSEKAYQKFGMKNRGKIEKDVIDAFMGFLGSVYAVGNMTSAAVTSRGGALDNWDAKLKNIHEKYIKEEKAWVDYVKTNKFECYFVDKDPRKEIIPFWSYGPSKLANATDKDWKEYFENAKE